jgi:hypothetical protein
MLQKIKKCFYALLERHKQKKQINAREFRRMTREIAYLAEIAVKLGPEQNQAMERLKKIRTEMNKLSRLVDSRDFTKIPPSARLELRESLRTSREQLVETINHAPTPTNTLQ